jgi:hypothetical protein
MFTKFARATTLLALVAAVGCSDDSPTAPEYESQVVDPPVNAVALLRSSDLEPDLTVSAVIGPEGGTFEIPAAGLKVTVPRNAVTEEVTFTATALPGDVLGYEFGPHGTEFQRPLVMEQQLANTGWELLGRPGNLEVGYFASGDAIDYEAGEVRVDEFLPVIVNPSLQTATFRVRHFSGYMLSTGRKLQQ